MPVSMSAAQREAFASAKATVLHALTFENAAWAGTLDVVQDTASHSLTDELASARTYAPVSYRLAPPEVGPDAAYEMRIDLECVRRDVIELIEQATAAAGVITVTYRGWAADDPSAPIYGPISLQIAEINATLTTLSMRAADTDVANRAYPNEDYTPSRFPGLVA